MAKPLFFQLYLKKLIVYTNKMMEVKSIQLNYSYSNVNLTFYSNVNITFYFNVNLTFYSNVNITFYSNVNLTFYSDVNLTFHSDVNLTFYSSVNLTFYSSEKLINLFQCEPNILFQDDNNNENVIFKTIGILNYFKQNETLDSNLN